MKIGLMYISDLESSKIVNSVMDNVENMTNIEPCSEDNVTICRVKGNLGKNYGPRKRFDYLNSFDYIYILREEIEDLENVGVVVDSKRGTLQLQNTLLSVRVMLYNKEDIMNPLPERPKFILLDMIKEVFMLHDIIKTN